MYRALPSTWITKREAADFAAELLGVKHHHDWQWPPRWDGDRDGPGMSDRGRRWARMTSREIVTELGART